MTIIKITLEHQNGKLFYTDSKENIIEVLKNLPKIQWKKTGTREELFTKYKTILEFVAKERGYTKEDFNRTIKRLIFPMFEDFPEYFISNFSDKDEKYSSKNLTLKGLQAAIINLEDLKNHLK